MPPAERADSCLVCDTALAGVAGALLRLGGVRRSAQNPNLCNRCDAHIEDGRIVELAVLFADLTGYTPLTHELGPDRMAALLDRFLRATTDIVVKWHGFVTQFVGDEVMAFFNVPLKRDDFASQAARAAHELQQVLPELAREFGVEVRATVGIAAGHARVGRVGSEHIRHYSAIGDVVNRAARLVSRAEPGAVLVDEAVYASVADEFPDAVREVVELKGLAEPVKIATLSGRVIPDDNDRSDATVERRRRPLRLATLLSAILAAPCAGVLVLSPVGVALGVGSLGLGALVPLLDQSAVRIPLLVLATLGALANLFVVFRGAREKDGATIEIAPTRLERTRTRAGVLLSGAALATVGFELIAHQVMH